jgi:serine/threonine protein kinase
MEYKNRLWFIEDKEHDVYKEYPKNPNWKSYLIGIAEQYSIYNNLMHRYPKDTYCIVIKKCDYISEYKKEHKKLTELYNSINNLSISPELIEIVKLTDTIEYGWYENGEKLSFNFNILYCIVTKKYGVSLLEKYLNNDIIQFGGPGFTSNTFNEYFDEFFPDTIPSIIRSQIYPLVLKFKDAGWLHDDIHAGNFVVENDIVKIIDFDCVSRYY